MPPFVLPDPYEGWSEERLKKRCRELVRSDVNKDMLICMLVNYGSAEAMPLVFGDKVRKIVATYCDDT